MSGGSPGGGRLIGHNGEGFDADCFVENEEGERFEVGVQWSTDIFRLKLHLWVKEGTPTSCQKLFAGSRELHNSTLPITQVPIISSDFQLTFVDKTLGDYKKDLGACVTDPYAARENIVDISKGRNCFSACSGSPKWPSGGVCLVPRQTNRKGVPSTRPNDPGCQVVHIGEGRDPSLEAGTELQRPCFG